jgi:hypothetical protein
LLVAPLGFLVPVVVVAGLHRLVPHLVDARLMSPAHFFTELSGVFAGVAGARAATFLPARARGGVVLPVFRFFMVARSLLVRHRLPFQRTRTEAVSPGARSP